MHPKVSLSTSQQIFPALISFNSKYVHLPFSRTMNSQLNAMYCEKVHKSTFEMFNTISPRFSPLTLYHSCWLCNCRCCKWIPEFLNEIMWKSHWGAFDMSTELFVTSVNLRVRINICWLKGMCRAISALKSLPNSSGKKIEKKKSRSRVINKIYNSTMTLVKPRKMA